MGLARDFSSAIQSRRISHIGNQIIKILNDIFLKGAAELVAQLYEKSAHYQVNANARKDNNHQKLGEYRTYDSVKKINPHNFQ